MKATVIKNDERAASIGRIDESVGHLIRVRDTARHLEARLSELRLAIATSSDAKDKHAAVGAIYRLQEAARKARTEFDLASDEAVVATAWMG